MPAGTFAAADDGSAMVTTHADGPAGKAAITDEPAAGSGRPTGSVLIAGVLPQS